MFLLYCPCPNSDVAKNLARRLVGEKLAFCCNIISGVESVFFWEGKVQEDNEALLLVKILASDPQPTIDCLETHHPYDVPVVACLPIAHINSEFKLFLQGKN